MFTATSGEQGWAQVGHRRCQMLLPVPPDLCPCTWSTQTSRASPFAPLSPSYPELCGSTTPIPAHGSASPCRTSQVLLLPGKPTQCHTLRCVQDAPPEPLLPTHLTSHTASFQIELTDLSAPAWSSPGHLPTCHSSAFGPAGSDSSYSCSPTSPVPLLVHTPSTCSNSLVYSRAFVFKLAENESKTQAETDSILSPAVLWTRLNAMGRNRR